MERAESKASTYEYVVSSEFGHFVTFMHHHHNNNNDFIPSSLKHCFSVLRWDLEYNVV